MVFDEMATICSDFKWFGFQISDTIQNPEHLQQNLILNIQNPEKSQLQTDPHEITVAKSVLF